MVAEIFGFPFDPAKVRLQAQVLSFANKGFGFAYNGPLHCLHRTWTEEGFRGLYRGLSMPLVGSMPYTTGLFPTYSPLQDAIRKVNHEDPSQKRELTIPEIGVATTGAGFLTSFILTPLELVKCRMQTQMMSLHSREVRCSLKPSFLHIPITEPFFSSTPLPSLVPPGALSIIQNILRDNGLKGFWLGQTGTLFRETGGTAVWFIVKEIVADALRNRKRQNHLATTDSNKPVPRSAESSMDILLWESATAGAVAGGVSTLFLYPADTVKSAIQTEEELRPPLRTRQTLRQTTFWRTAFSVYHARGLSGCNNGSLIETS